PITVATFAGAYRHMPALGDKFGLLIVDEAHHFAAGGRDETLEMSIAPLRLGLTATPPAPGPAAERLAGLIGRVVFERTVGDLEGRYLAPLERITGASRSTPTSGASTTRSGPSTARPGARSRPTTWGRPGKTSCTTLPGPTRG